MEFENLKIIAGPMQIDLNLLHDFPRNVRLHRNHVEDERLKLSLKKNGQKEPAFVREHPTITNEFEKLSGNRRAEQLEALGHKSMLCIVVEASDKEALEFAIISNDLTDHKRPPLERAMNIQHLRESGYNNKQICGIYGWKGTSTLNQFDGLLENVGDDPELTAAFGGDGDSDLPTLTKAHWKRSSPAPEPYRIRLLQKSYVQALSAWQVETIAEAIKVAVDHGDKAQAAIMSSKTRVFNPDKHNERSFMEKYDRQNEQPDDVSKFIRTPAVAEILRSLKHFRKRVRDEFSTATEVGRASPEGKDFLARRINEIEHDLEVWRKELEKS